MRQKISFVLGLLLGAALVELLTRGRHSQRKRLRDPRTEELRRKLAEQREQREQPFEATPAPVGAESAAPRSAEPSAKRQGAAVGYDVTADRGRIYEEGRAAVDEMRRSGEPRESPP